MKITFDEKGYEYIEVAQTDKGIYVVISAKGKDDPRKTVVNSAELTKEQFFQLVSEIN